MPIDRFFINSELKKDSEILIQDQEFHHLSRVTRTKEGDTVDVVNGRGQLAKAIVDRIEKRKALLLITKIEESPPTRLKTVLVQAIPRINRLDLIVEKGTELGMAELWLFPGEKSEKKQLSEQQLNRLKTISISAMKQCGRLYLPPITIRPLMAKWESYPSPSYFGDLSEAVPTIFEEWQKSPPSNELYFFIGPESGFTDREVELLKENQAKGVSMHKNILRTDTAAITALAIINHFAMTLPTQG